MASSASTIQMPASARVWRFIKDHAPELLYLCVVVFMHTYFNYRGNSDDAVFATALDKYSYIEFLSGRYAHWTSRVIIEGVLILVARKFMVWRLLDIAICWLVYHALIKLFPPAYQQSVRWPLMLVLLVYPFADMGECGWMATTLNYLWPLAFGLWALSVLARYLRQDPGFTLTPLRAGAAFLAALFAANAEQMMVVMGAILLVVLIAGLRQKKADPFVIALLVAVIANALLIGFCAGNGVRNDKEMLTWWPDTQHFYSWQNVMWSDLNLATKLYLGLTTMFDRYFYGVCHLGLLLALVLVFSAFASDSFSRGYRVFSVFTCAVLAFFNVVSVYKNASWPAFVLKLVSQPLYDISVTRVCTTLLQCIVFGSLLWQTYVVVKHASNQKQALAVVGILVLGAASRMAMSFSPTIFPSGWRTAIFFDASLTFGITVLWLITRKANRELVQKNLITFALVSMWAAPTTLSAIINIWT